MTTKEEKLEEFYKSLIYMIALLIISITISRNWFLMMLGLSIFVVSNCYISYKFHK